ncbi:unnamed protein product [Brassica napus]|uniref:(rape) hypothetical protein n=1 Tax=Brassica napus TaxID=3708 RepID=A0A816PQT8_BRANA|nr:unnamed protein product [Brassica napus]
MRIREPKTTALIFASGRMVCTGAKTEDSSKLAARNFPIWLEGPTITTLSQATSRRCFRVLFTGSEG